MSPVRRSSADVVIVGAGVAGLAAARCLREEGVRVTRHVMKTLRHDWSRDPYSRGAYSYSLVGGSDVGKRLSRPVRGTLFFAGEAADAEGRTGTVHGAIGSGYHSANRRCERLGAADLSLPWRDSVNAGGPTRNCVSGRFQT